MGASVLMLEALKTEWPPRWLGCTTSKPVTPTRSLICQDWNLTDPAKQAKKLAIGRPTFMLKWAAASTIVPYNRNDYLKRI